jgi:two-component system response regulator PhoP
MRLLVIEDDNTLRESLAAQLAEAGYAVEQAADGREGLYFAMEYPVDLAIIDLGLPEVSGLDIIREAREKGKTYPILILTARDRWQDKVDGLSAGADDYVVKPFHFEEVSARVHALLAHRADQFRIQDHRVPDAEGGSGDIQDRADRAPV